MKKINVPEKKNNGIMEINQNLSDCKLTTSTLTVFDNDNGNARTTNAMNFGQFLRNIDLALQVIRWLEMSS